MPDSSRRWVVAPGPVAPRLRIGLFGGSFDPAHGGHLYASLVALKSLRLDYLWWLVSPQNPLKPQSSPFAARLSGARRIARHPRIIVTDIERRLGTIYTIDTLIALQRRFAGVEFIWIMGSDNLKSFRRWRRWREIARRVKIVVVRRPGSQLASLPYPGMSALTLDGARSRESSTAARALVGKPPPC